MPKKLHFDQKAILFLPHVPKSFSSAPVFFQLLPVKHSVESVSASHVSSKVSAARLAMFSCCFECIQLVQILVHMPLHLSEAFSRSSAAV